MICDCLSHALSLKAGAVGFGDQIPGVHVTVHAHGYAFLARANSNIIRCSFTVWVYSNKMCLHVPALSCLERVLAL